MATVNSEAQYKKMTEQSVWKLVIILGIPTTISMLITNIYNMADTYFVSSLGIAQGGAPQAFPDFTKGKWISRSRLDVVDFPTVTEE